MHPVSARSGVTMDWQLRGRQTAGHPRQLVTLWCATAPEEITLSSSLKKSRPTATGALVEAILMLAVGLAVAGACRGWFTYSGGNRIKPTSNGNI